MSTTQRYKTLQEKLQELEAKLSIVFSLPAGSPHDHLHSECIKQRFAFLKNLLSAEIASRPSRSSHLGHIGKRLAQLEIAFRNVVDDEHNKKGSAGDMNVNYFDITTPAAADAASSVCSCNDVEDDESFMDSDHDDGEATIDLTSPELGSSDDELDQPQMLNRPPLTKVVKSQRNHGSRESSNSDEEVIIIQGQSRKKNNSPWAAPHLQGSSEHDKVHQQNIKDEVYVLKNVGRSCWSGKYWGTLISGMTLGMVLMGAGAAIAMVGESASFYSTPPHDGLLFYT